MLLLSSFWGFSLRPPPPQIKQLVGRRLARAARALVYGKKDTPWTGPVLAGCTVGTKSGGDFMPNITLNFRQVCERREGGVKV